MFLLFFTYIGIVWNKYSDVVGVIQLQRTFPSFHDKFEIDYFRLLISLLKQCGYRV